MVPKSWTGSCERFILTSFQIEEQTIEIPDHDEHLRKYMNRKFSLVSLSNGGVKIYLLVIKHLLTKNDILEIVKVLSKEDLSLLLNKYPGLTSAN